MNFLQILLAIFPGLVIALLIYRADKYEHEHWLPLGITFLMGVLITFPIIKLQEWYNDLGWDSNHTLWSTFISAFILVSLSEETCKCLGLLIYPFRKKFFNEPLDGIVYSVMIGMGFATLENLLYAFRYDIGTTAVRALTAVPAHATFAAIMGFYVGRAKFRPHGKWKLILKGWAIAVGIHGLYDFFILQQLSEELITVALLILSVSMFFAIRMIRIVQQESPFREP